MNDCTKMSACVIVYSVFLFFFVLVCASVEHWYRKHFSQKEPSLISFPLREDKRQKQSMHASKSSSQMDTLCLFCVYLAPESSWNLMCWSHSHHKLWELKAIGVGGLSCSPGTHFMLTGFVWFAVTWLDEFAPADKSRLISVWPWSLLGTSHLWGRTSHTPVAAEVLTFPFHFTLHWRHGRGVRAQAEIKPLWKLAWKVLMMPHFRIY